MRRLGVLFITALTILTALPAGAEVTQAELKEARRKVDEKSAELEQELAALDAVIAQQADYQRRIAQLREQIADRERLITLSEFAAREQARAMYVSAGATAFQTAASPEGVTRLGTKTAYLDAVVNIDVDAANQLAYLVEDRSSLQGELSTLLAEQDEIAGQI